MTLPLTTPLASGTQIRSTITAGDSGIQEGVYIVDSTGTVVAVDATWGLNVKAAASGTIAHDAAGSGIFPVIQGGIATAAPATAVSADGDAVQAAFARTGEQYVFVSASQVVIQPTGLSTAISVAYTALDVMGAKLTFSNAARAATRGGTISQVTLKDRKQSSIAARLWMFGKDPGYTATDNAAFNPTAAQVEAGNFLGVFEFSATNWKSPAAASSIATQVGYFEGSPTGPSFVVPSGVASPFPIYGYLQLVSGTFTASTTGDLTIEMTIQQD
jgi:hypothetical protein